MSVVDYLRSTWDGMDEIDRKNFWIGVIGVILVIIVILQLSNALGSIGSIFGKGAGFVNESVQGMSKFSGVK